MDKKSGFYYKKSWVYLVICEMILMMWATDNLMHIKIGIMGGIIVTAFLLKKPFTLSRSIFIWSVCYVIVNVFFMMLSVGYGNPGAFVRLNVDVVEPIIYMLLFSVIDNKDYKVIKKAVIYISFFIYVYTIVGFLSINNLIPISNMPFMLENFGGVLLFGLKKVASSYVAWFCFLVPANTLLYFFVNEIQDNKIKKVIRINFVLGIVCVLLTLRTAVMLITIFSVLLSAYIYFKASGKKLFIKRKQVITGMVLLLIMIVIWNYFDLGILFKEIVVKKIVVSFNVSDVYTNIYGVSDSGGNTRSVQIAAMLDTWLKKPILGWGSGANAIDVIRSDVYGSYEITYVARLMQRGIVGFSIYVMMVAWLFIKGIKLAKYNTDFRLDIMYVLMGLFGILVACASNPYLESFDKLIILFLPLLLYNLTNKKKYK